MFLTFYLDSTLQSTDLVGYHNMSVNQMTLISSYCATSSPTRGLYFVNIEDLFTDQIINNVHSKNLLPVPYGSNVIKMPLSPNYNLKKTYRYQIYDETGNITTDNVKITLIFQI